MEIELKGKKEHGKTGKEPLGKRMSSFCFLSCSLLLTKKTGGSDKQHHHHNDDRGSLCDGGG
jgi:hypothetical protein